MGLRVHHLNCGSLCPLGGSLLSVGGQRLQTMVCHCLLIETNSGLVLVDTGLGLADVQKPDGRLSRPFRTLARPRLDPAETAIRQVERLGFAAADVRHILLTHLDIDHAGGLADFPHATVHLLGSEWESATVRPVWQAGVRYHPHLWAHDPQWLCYEASGEPWFGFDCVRELKGLPPEILLIPLGGHSEGHCGIAVDTGESWLLHAGDAYYWHGEVHGAVRRCPPALDAFSRILQSDEALRFRNQDRLRQLIQGEGERVHVFCAHDAAEMATV